MTNRKIPLSHFSKNDCNLAGNRNDSDLNNSGSNGNYWSSTPNENNSKGAYILNFNSGNQNVNNNNRNNGQSVRPVLEFTTPCISL